MTINRRALVATLAAATLHRGSRVRAAEAPAFAYPVALPGRAPGDGLIIRHGFCCENSWYNPSDLHTGEDWYRLDGAETGGTSVIAMAAGEVVYVGSEYPGLVVIVRHAPTLYSMYGHLSRDAAVARGDRVERGQPLGTVLTQVGGIAPSHLHLEVRTFLTTPEVNGDAPRYNYACGVDCPPGPGYWPIDAPDHPTVQGWRNPMHVAASRAFPGATQTTGGEVIVAEGAPATAALFSVPPADPAAEPVGELTLAAGDRYPWLALETGREAAKSTSAEAYRLWYRVEAPAGPAWLQAALPDRGDLGGDGRPSSVRLVMVPSSR